MECSTVGAASCLLKRLPKETENMNILYLVTYMYSKDRFQVTKKISRPKYMKYKDSSTQKGAP